MFFDIVSSGSSPDGTNTFIISLELLNKDQDETVFD